MNPEAQDMQFFCSAPLGPSVTRVCVGMHYFGENFQGWTEIEKEEDFRSQIWCRPPGLPQAVQNEVRGPPRRNPLPGRGFPLVAVVSCLATLRPAEGRWWAKGGMWRKKEKNEKFWPPAGQG